MEEGIEMQLILQQKLSHDYNCIVLLM